MKDYKEISHGEMLTAHMAPVQFEGTVQPTKNNYFDVELGDGNIIVALVNESRKSECAALLRAGSIVRVFGVADGPFRTSPRKAFVLADRAEAASVDRTLPPPLATYERMNMGSMEELLYFKMNYAGTPGYALIPQYRVAVGSKEYRVDFALVNLRTDKVAAFIEVDGRQHEKSMTKDAVRAHEIEQSTGVQVKTITAHNVREQAKERGLL